MAVGENDTYDDKGRPVVRLHPDDLAGSGGGGGGTAYQFYDTNGDGIPNGLPQTLAYNGDGTVDTITMTDGEDTWVQTFSYTNGNLTGDSGWVKQ